MVTWIVDPSHAWLEIDLTEYPEALEYGTGYGYHAGHLAYLEEDCEAPKFLAAHPEIDRRMVRSLHYSDDAPCRLLPRIANAVG